MNVDMIRAELNHIVECTDDLSFKLFSSYKKKKAQLLRIKDNIDTQIDQLIQDQTIDKELLLVERISLWVKADADARKEFGPLEERKMMNDFFLEEVMHRYAEAQADFILGILQHKEGGIRE